ncbi:MAG: ABC-F family ATP-binding cassette domain-containing protein [Flavobacteriales bacterium]|nr:ABC-F family ATP-binding cassette domain-containing protein [Flavobacteriales bacterium]
MNYLSVENLSKSFGERILFQNLSFGISKGQKIALVARNGTGKSTLFNVLAGTDTADEGSVVFNNDVRLSMLAQHHGLDEELNVLENLFAGNNDMLTAIRQYEAALASHASPEVFQKACDAMDHAGAWDYEARSKEILGKLGIHDLEQSVNTLSGGQKRRIALARVLIEEPDFVFLDEPTNHLDLDMIEWLETYLAQSNITIFMITHDRYFLEVICDEIFELDDRQLYRYKGNYSYFLEKKAEREELEFASREKARNLLRRELVWMRSTPKARTGKSKYRKEQFATVKENARKQLEEDELRLEINIQRLGGKIIEFHRVKMGYDNLTILNGFDYVFRSGERVAIAGRNGTGKTTILNLITGQTEPDGGKIVIGDTVVFGYYSQKGLNVKPGQRVLEVVREIADVIPLKNGKKITAEQMLERFLFPRSTHRDLVEKLSGGEQKRLHLLCVLMSNPNVLILDEPTNDLDVFTLAVLEEYLLQFPGVLIVVSHDRFLMDKLCDHILALDGLGNVSDITGNYSEWRMEQVAIAREERRGTQEKKEVTREKVDQPKTKLSFKEKFEFEQLEKEIPQLSQQKEELSLQLNSGEIADHTELSRLAEELGRITDELDMKEMRWLELSEFM